MWLRRRTFHGTPAYRVSDTHDERSAASVHVARPSQDLPLNTVVNLCGLCRHTIRGARLAQGFEVY